MEAYIECRSGTKFYFLDPQQDQINIADIGYALAHQCRFNGHCSRFYSVAEHSVLVASLVPEEYKLAALLHDASEAFLSDIPSPVKQFMPEYKKLEATVMAAIVEKYDIPLWDSAEVHRADRQQLCSEAHALIISGGKTWEMWKPEHGGTPMDYRDGRKPMCMAPIDAFGLFMNTYENLTSKLNKIALVI